MSKEPMDVYGVFYSDGGYKPNFHIGGWGVHGYLYTKQESKTGTGLKDHIPTELGYRVGNTLPLPVTVTEYLDGLGSIVSNATNNVAEVHGLMKLLEFIIHRDLKGAHLVLDSKYALQGFNEWVENWESKQWIKSDGGPVANKDYWIRVLELKRELQKKSIKVTTAWTKGHQDGMNDSFGNNLVDTHCNHACFSAINGSEIDRMVTKPARGYWKPKIDRNRLLDMPTILFMPLASRKDATGVYTRYHLTNIRTTDEFIGKRLSAAQFAVVLLKEPDPTLESIQDAHDAISRRTGMVMPVKIDTGTLFKPDNYKLVAQQGTDFLIVDTKNHALTTTSKVVLSRAMEPPRLVFRAIDALEVLNTRLQHFIDTQRAGLANEQPDIVYTDITEQLYAMVEKGKKTVRKLKDTVTSLTASMDFNVGYRTETDQGETKLKLTLSLDLPDRNTLSAVAGGVTAVNVVTWPEASGVIRYAVILETVDDCSIWAAVYSNFHFLSSSSA